MSKRHLRIAIFLSLGIVGAVLLMMQRQRRPSTARTQVGPLLVVKTPVGVRTQPAGLPALQADARVRLAPRPSANTASHNVRRSGLAWILRQLGASEKLLDRLADGDLVASLTELKQQAASGDATAINILGFIAYEKCYLARSEEQISGYEAAQLTSAKLLAPDDAAWFGTALQQTDIHDRQFTLVCSQLLDQDQVLSWVSGRAAQGDGASLWLLSLASSNLAESQQRLRDAAAAGFPQAQFELAWAILSGQQRAAGSGPNAVTAEDLLRQAADQLPIAEANLSLCEYSGCEGLAPDITAALTHARDAAQKGTIDAIIALGPRLPTGQISPDELAAWNLVYALLQQNGCSVSGLTVVWMKSTTATLAATNISSSALVLADQYWRNYRTQMMANLGCGS